MKLIVGLGNPGDKYRNTRHNAGFWVVEKLARALDCPKFGLEGKLKSEIIGGRVNGTNGVVEPILLIKPQTYMNGSGEAVKLIFNYYNDRVTLEDLIVVHDDVDLEFGRIKIQRGGGTAGHHGIDSIVGQVGHGFIRVRLGVGRPKNNKLDVEDFVLEQISPQEAVVFEAMTDRAVEAILWAAEYGITEAMNKFNS